MIYFSHGEGITGRKEGQKMSMIEKMVGPLAGVKVVGMAVIIDKGLYNAEILRKELMERLPVGIWVLVA